MPKTSETTHLINEARIKLMKPGVRIINCARGGLIDEAALLEGIKAGIVAGAALDVFHQEPYQGPLATLPNVFLTCHQGSCSHDGRYQMEIQSAQNAVNFALGRPIEADRIVWLPGMQEPAVDWLE